jgi:biopolymer transport protein ExbB/biopolymer transport protein TolQ
MLFASLAQSVSIASVSAKIHVAALWVFEQQGSSLNLIEMWGHMGWPARIVAIVLFLMSAWSMGVMIDRWLAFRAARRQSLQFAPALGGALREGKIAEAIRIADRNRKSHLARVLTSGLQEYHNFDGPAEVADEKIEASRRALERTEAIVHAELERGLSGLATVGSTAPFVGLLGTVIGIIDAFASLGSGGAGMGFSAVSRGISEALVTTALGLFVAIPAVMMFNYFSAKIKAFDVEMDNSASELVDYLLMRTLLSKG